MNLKFRFAILFTFFVALIMVITSAAIYLLYYNYRAGDYFRRLRSEGVSLYEDFASLKAKGDTNAVAKLYADHKNVFYDEQLLMWDSDFHLVYKEPDTLHFNTDTTFFQNILKAPTYEYRYKTGARESVGLYEEKTKVYVLVSAIDRYGLSRLRTLKIILAGAFIGGLFLTGFVSFFFVRQAFKPLSKLSMQMQLTNELNLSEKVDEGQGNDEVRKIARSFNAMLDRLKEGFESQKNFVHHASHELRTPLATMLSRTESALNKDLSKEEHQKVLESLREDQIGLVELTNSLLLLSQYEKIQTTSQWPPVRIDEILYDTISATKKMLPFIDVELEFTNIPEDENDLVLRGNDALLKVAFTNLIKNAWQYSTDRKVTVIIETNPEQIKVHVDNHGEHLSSSEIEKLKVPFFRGNNAAHTKGFGLGLSIVQRIVLLHNGNLEYSAQQPGVNRFTITFTV